MYSKHLELMAFEMILRVQGTKECDIRQMIDLFDQVYEMGYARGKQEAVLETMMEENNA